MHTQTILLTGLGLGAVYLFTRPTERSTRRRTDEQNGQQSQLDDGSGAGDGRTTLGDWVDAHNVPGGSSSMPGVFRNAQWPPPKPTAQQYKNATIGAGVGTTLGGAGGTAVGAGIGAAVGVWGFGAGAAPGAAVGAVVGGGVGTVGGAVAGAAIAGGGSYVADWLGSPF